MAKPYPNNFFLTGFMGAGKSTVGPLLANALGWSFTDTDHEIERLAGLRIPEVFASGGEAAFRRLESQVVKQVAARQGQVVALGGGALSNPESQRVVLAAGTLIYLQARPETLLQRIHPAERPMLRDFTGAALRERVQDLMKERAPHYLRAQLTIETDALTPAEIVQKIRENWA